MSGDAPRRNLWYHDIVIALGIEANTKAMAVAHAIGTRDRGATCRICGQPALPVVRLCAQCKAALKRVRHDTVSQHMPMTRRARGGDRARREIPRVDVDGGEHRGSAGAFRGMRAPIAVAALVAIVGSAGYFIVQQIHAAMPPEVSAAARGASDRVSAAPLLPPVAATAPEPLVPAPANSVFTSNDAVPPAVAKPKVAPRVVKPVPAPVTVPTPEVRPEPAPAPVVVAAAPPPAVRPPDPMQLLAQAFAQCPTDGMFARISCEQKARIRYCDGYWGRAPMCPDGAPDRSLSH
jgi:hypothetical protein